MLQEDKHVMELVQLHPSGAEEWFCPTCGRRFLMQWPPNYSRVILEAGDETALHSGGKGGLQLSSVQVTQESEALTENDPSLQPWMNWLASVDIEARLDE